MWGFVFRLMAIVAEQDLVLAEMADRTREIQEATAQRQMELNQLRAAREQREQAAKEASANENKPHQKDHQKDDKDPDPGGASSTSTYLNPNQGGGDQSDTSRLRRLLILPKMKLGWSSFDVNSFLHV